jgi:DnaJ-domain-containing protein 1
LDRALLLYESVCFRLREISAHDNGERGGWLALFGRGVEMRQQEVDERDDLEAHAHHLRGTIARLKRRPLQRLTTWLRILNWRFALGGALAAHLAAFALLIALHASSASELATRTKSPLIWYPFDARLFYANAVAAGFAAAAAVALFLLRRANLRRTYSFELRTLKEFSAADPGQAIEQLKVDTVGSNDGGKDYGCFAVLGLPHSATIEEVRDAYKRLIKQNHPDRVLGMSPAFRRLAETETKKLNAAYQHAVFALTPVESRKRAAAN